MKLKLVFSLILMSFSSASYSKEYGALSSLGGITNTLKEYCSKSNSSHSTKCLRAFLSYRCLSNHIFSDPIYASKCIEGVEQLVFELDLTQVPISEDQNRGTDSLKLHEVAFSNKLLNIFSTPADQFSKMIKQYQSDFEDSYRFSKPHSLWERTLINNNNNPEKALETMVTLFQDFSSKGYFQFLDQSTQSSSKKTKLLIEANLLTANSFYDTITTNRIVTNSNPLYSIFPDMKEAGQFTSMIHHFYTPAYLAMKLKKQGVEDGVAFYVSFLFNTSYEFIKLDQKMKTKRWPYRDPISFDANQYALQVQKIYTGYIGALWGIDMESKAISFQSFSKKLAANPNGFVSSLHF